MTMGTWWITFFKKIQNIKFKKKLLINNKNIGVGESRNKGMF